MNVKSVLFTGAMIALVMIELIIAPKQSLLIAIVMTLGFWQVQWCYLDCILEVR